MTRNVNDMLTQSFQQLKKYEAPDKFLVQTRTVEANVMKVLMEKEGLPYGNRIYTYNSRLAQELASWADTQAGGETIHDLLYTAYFVEGKNIGDIDVLLEITKKAGLSIVAAGEVIEKRSYKEIVDSDWAKSRQYGVTGVPIFVANGYGVVGAQPYESLEELIIQSGAQPRIFDEGN